jgi:dihydrofolate synthase/folylpolyglutamate synthase
MTYQEATEFILSIPKFTSKNKPEHTRLFLQYLGHPEQHFQVIHVAGTNGKGSVCAYLDAMLRAQGKSVGLFTSPHLVRINERIVVNGEMLSDEQFLSVFEKVQAAVGRMQEVNLPHPTFFEFLFGMAVTAFAEAKVEYAVLETGLGGRLDATNTVEQPVCSVITSIGYDHTELLGDTLEEIAAEKAGIIKKGTPVVYIEGAEESNRVIEETAKNLGNRCKKIGKNAFKILGIQNKSIAFSCVSAYYEDVTWKLHNTGIYQPENACLALEVMRLLFQEKKQLRAWREALEQVIWQGRMEEVQPDIYIDGAHNISAVERFAESVKRNPSGQGTILLFSAVQDKDYEQMIAYLCRQVDAELYLVTQIQDKRAEDRGTLTETFRRFTDRPVLEMETLADAWKYIMNNQNGRRVYCLGSLYLVGMIKELMEQREK